VTAVLVAAFFITGGTVIPSSFAAPSDLTQNETRQFVPVVALGQANTESPVTHDPFPSGSAIPSDNPLSVSTPAPTQNGGPVRQMTDASVPERAPAPPEAPATPQVLQTPDPQNGWQLKFATETDAHYEIQVSTDHVHWQTRAILQATSAEVSWVDPLATPAGSRFYRVGISSAEVTGVQYHVYAGDAVQKVIDKAAAGDTVHFHSGTYHQHLILKQSVDIQGEDPKTTIIHGDFLTKTDVLRALGNNRIEGLTITGGGAYDGGSSSAIAVMGDNVKIRNNRILDNRNYGIYVSSGVDTLIELNLIKDTNVGVQLPQDSSLVRYNTFVRNTIAVNVLSGARPRIDHNIFTESTFQSIYEFSWDAYSKGQPSRGFAIVENNTFFNNVEHGTAYGSATPPAAENQTAGNLKMIPRFMDATQGNYYIQPFSSSYGRGAFLPKSLTYALDRASQFHTQNHIEPIQESGQVTGYRIVYAEGSHEEFYNDGRQVLDTTPPAIAFLSAQLTNQSEYQLVYNLDGVPTAESHTLTEGDNTFTVSASDIFGNTAKVPVTVVLDTEPPRVVVKSTVPSLTNHATLFVSYSVDGGPEQQKEFTLTEGENTRLTITATDDATNIATITLPKVILDSSASDFSWISNGTGANLWSVAANWVNAIIPSLSDIAVFGPYGIADCIIDEAASVRGINIVSGYTGTITQQADVITGDYSQEGGRWIDADPTAHAFKVGGSFAIPAAAGSFNRYGDPVDGAYQVRDVYDLQAMSGYLFSNFRLADDIDASSTARWNSGAGFNPIGNDDPGYPLHDFFGIFDGAGHTIAGLTIHRPTENKTGLFGSLMHATLHDVGLVDESVTGADRVGGLVGTMESSSILNSYVTGNVGSDRLFMSNVTGGLVGDMIDSFIAESHADVDVSGNSYVGGFVGQNSRSSISMSYATGRVTGGGERVGGLIGLSQYDSTISDSYATGRVFGFYGSRSVGGLAGENLLAAITSSYATGAVQGDAAVGGLAGYNNGRVLDSYATGNVSSGDASRGNIGGFIGFNQGIIVNAAATGDVIEGNSIIGNNGNIGGLVGGNWGSILTASAAGAVVGSAYSFNIGGLVGGNYGSIENARASGSVTGADESRGIGGLVGLNSGAVRKVYATGAVTGGGYDSGNFGGLVGNNAGSIEDAYATGNVTLAGDNTNQNNGNIGGFVGGNSGSILNAYATGIVTAAAYTTRVGGLAGFNDAPGNIQSVFSTGIVNSAGSIDVGGLVGNSAGVITNSGWWTGSVAQALGTGGTVTYNEADKNAFMNSSHGVYTAGITTWDFPNVWVPFDYELPHLQWENYISRPLVVLDPTTPSLINSKSLTVRYTVNGSPKTKLFENLGEGEKTLTFTEDQTVVTWNVTVDTVAPTGSVVINNGASFTNNLNVILTLNASDFGSGLSQMRFSMDYGATWSDWENYASTRSLALFGTAGSKTVLAQVRDRAGNILSASDQITFDAAYVHGEKTYTVGDKLLTIVMNPFPGDPNYSASAARWTQQEMDLLWGFLDQIIPAIKQVYGNPFQSLVTSLVPSREGGGGEYFTQTFNGTVISRQVVLGVSAGIPYALGSLVHEFAHVFRDEATVGLYELLEEGMAEAVEDLALQSTSLVHPYKPFHSDPEQIYYEGAVGDAYLGGVGVTSAGVLTRDLGSYFWSKLYLEDSTFFMRFNEAYYSILRRDPTIRSDQTRLLNLAASLKPTVEGLPFWDWLELQDLHVLSSEIYQSRVGEGLYIRNGFRLSPGVFAYEITAGPRGSSAWIPGTYFFRNTLANREVQISVYDADGSLLVQKTAMSNVLGMAPLDEYGLPYSLPTGYTGRVKVIAQMTSASGSVAETHAYLTAINGKPAFEANGYSSKPNGGSAVFGVLTTINQGEITLKKAGTDGPVYTAQVINGAFNFPDLPQQSGTFEITYNNPYTGQQLTRLFTKDQSQYYVQFDTSSLNPDTQPPVIVSMDASVIARTTDADILFSTSKPLAKATLLYRLQGSQGEPLKILLDPINAAQVTFHLSDLGEKKTYEYWAEVVDSYGFKKKSSVATFKSSAATVFLPEYQSVPVISGYDYGILGKSTSSAKSVKKDDFFNVASSDAVSQANSEKMDPATKGTSKSRLKESRKDLSRVYVGSASQKVSEDKASSQRLLKDILSSPLAGTGFWLLAGSSLAETSDRA